jgi:hypothetical protein
MEARTSSFTSRQKAGLGLLNEGDKVSYEVVTNRGKETRRTFGSVIIAR